MEHQDFIIFFSQKNPSKKEHKRKIEDIKNCLDITSPLEMFSFRTTFYMIYSDNPRATKLTKI